MTHDGYTHDLDSYASMGNEALGPLICGNSFLNETRFIPIVSKPIKLKLCLCLCCRDLILTLP